MILFHRQTLKPNGATTWLIYAILLMYVPNYVHIASWNKLHVICLTSFSLWLEIMSFSEILYNTG
jgi:hypothetical protein